LLAGAPTASESGRVRFAEPTRPSPVGGLFGPFPFFEPFAEARPEPFSELGFFADPPGADFLAAGAGSLWTLGDPMPGEW